MLKIGIVLLVSFILLGLIIFYNKNSANQKELYENMRRGIRATLDSNNKVLNVKSDLSNDDNKKLMNYFNQNGVLKVKINTKKLILLIDNYVKLLSKNDFKINLETFKERLIGIILLFISHSGLAMVVDDENQKANEKKEQFEIIIPKILLSNERNQFIDSIIQVQISKKSEGVNSDLSKTIYDSMKHILNKIASESNPDLRISNLISLIIRTYIIHGIFTIMFINQINPLNELQFMSHVFFDFFNLIPTDRCIFNENNVIEFEPNVCNIKLNKQEECPKCVIPKCPECPECKKTNCPECQKCPECKKTECNCPECPKFDYWGEPSKILNIILTVSLIILALMYSIK